MMTQQGHIVKAYDDELAELDQMVEAMTAAVRQQIQQTVISVASFEPGMAEKAIEFDKRIDDMQVKMDEHATKMLALRQPLAQDLRKIVTSYRISNDLERVGDYAKNVCKRMNVLSEEKFPKDAGHSIERMGRLVDAMLEKVLRAYIEKDADLAMQVIKDDEEVDHAHTSFFREILTYMMEDTKYISACTHFMFITKNIERMGDHVTNIAEQVFYAVKGKHISDAHVSQDKSIGVEIAE